MTNSKKKAPRRTSPCFFQVHPTNRESPLPPGPNRPPRSRSATLKYTVLSATEPTMSGTLGRVLRWKTLSRARNDQQRVKFAELYLIHSRCRSSIKDPVDKVVKLSYSVDKKKSKSSSDKVSGTTDNKQYTLLLLIVYYSIILLIVSTCGFIIPAN